MSDKCPDCHSKMVVRCGRYGYFWGCSAYPKCCFTAPYDECTDAEGNFDSESWEEVKLNRELDGIYIASLNGG